MSMHQELNSSDIIQKIWSGTLTDLRHNLLTHKIELDIKVVDTGVEFKYLLVCSNVAELSILINHPEEDWDYVELTEVEIEKKDMFYHINCDLWSSGKMFIRCDLIDLIEK